jgi:glycerol kinase
VRAALESIAYQTRAVLDAMQNDAQLTLGALRIDGGATANDFLAQFQADLLGVSVERPRQLETTALGAAYLAGLAVGFWQNREEIARQWAIGRRFTPQLADAERTRLYAEWRQAVAATLEFRV